MDWSGGEARRYLVGGRANIKRCCDGGGCMEIEYPESGIGAAISGEDAISKVGDGDGVGIKNGLASMVAELAYGDEGRSGEVREDVSVARS